MAYGPAGMVSFRTLRACPRTVTMLRFPQSILLRAVLLLGLPWPTLSAAHSCQQPGLSGNLLVQRWNAEVKAFPGEHWPLRTESNQEQFRKRLVETGLLLEAQLDSQRCVRRVDITATNDDGYWAPVAWLTLMKSIEPTLSVEELRAVLNRLDPRGGDHRFSPQGRMVLRFQEFDGRSIFSVVAD